MGERDCLCEVPAEVAKQVALPDGSIGEFPDAMPDSEIEAVLQKQFPADTRKIANGETRGFAAGLASTTIDPIIAMARPQTLTEVALGPGGAVLAQTGRKLLEAYRAARAGKSGEAAASALEAVPIAGPVAESVSGPINRGDYAGAAGALTGLAATALLPKARGVPGKAGKLASSAARGAAEVATNPAVQDLVGTFLPNVQPAIRTAQRVVKTGQKLKKAVDAYRGKIPPPEVAEPAPPPAAAPATEPLPATPAPRPPETPAPQVSGTRASESPRPAESVPEVTDVEAKGSSAGGRIKSPVGPTTKAVEPSAPQFITEDALSRYAADAGLELEEARAALESEGYKAVGRSHLNRALHGLGNEMGLDHAALSDKAAHDYGVKSLTQLSQDQLLGMYDDLQSKRSISEPLKPKPERALTGAEVKKLAEFLKPGGITPGDLPRMTPEHWKIAADAAGVRIPTGASVGKVAEALRKLQAPPKRAVRKVLGSGGTMQE